METLTEQRAEGAEAQRKVERPLGAVLRWLGARPVLASALLATVFFFAAAARDRNAEWQARSVWGQLEPVAQRLAAGGEALTTSTLAHWEMFGWLGSAWFGILALMAAWRRNVSLAVASVAAAVLHWACLCFWSGQDPAAWIGLAVAGVGFAGAGLVRSQRVTEPSPDVCCHMDVPLVVCIVAAGALLRIYALTELPSFFIGEMGLSMLAGATWESLWRYVPAAVEDVSIGAVHLFLQWATFQIFGPSVFSLRLTAVVFGVALVWALYWFLRRSVGRQAALVAAVLAAAAPEQLWWSRNENSYFIAVCFAGTVTAWLSWEVRRHPSVRRIALVCLWMGLTRLFYLASVALFLVPIAVLFYAVLFERPRRRWFLAFFSVVIFGTCAWALSVSVVSYLGSGAWRFVHPARHGELVATSETKGVLTVIERQARRFADNARRVGNSLLADGNLDHWYQRVDWSSRTTWIHLGAGGLGLCGFLLASGQWRRPEAVLLWSWLLAGLAPALLAEQVASRRMTAAYPAFYAAAGYAWAWWYERLREVGCRITLVTASCLFWLLVAAVTLSAVSSHLALPTKELPLVSAARLVGKDFALSEAIFYDLDEAAFPIFAAVHANRWWHRTPCLQSIDSNWIESALGRRCAFDSASLRVAYSAETLEHKRLEEKRAQDFVRSPFSLWIGEVPLRRRKIERLRALYPEAEEECHNSDDASYSLCTFRIRDSDVRRLARVDVVTSRDSHGRLRRPRLEEPRVRVKSEQMGSDGVMQIKASLVVEKDGWYVLSSEAACEGIGWTLNEQMRVRPGQQVPLLAGFSPISISLPQTCDAPLRLRWRSKEGATVPLAMLDPALAQSELLRAPPMRVVVGVRSLGRLAEIRGQVRDVRPVKQGWVALIENEGEPLLQWFDQTGAVVREQRMPFLQGVPVHGMAVSPDGSELLLVATGRVFFLDGTAGELVAEWRRAELPTSDVAWLRPGQVVAALPSAGGLVLFDSKGDTVEVLRSLRGARERLFEPVGVARSPNGPFWALVETDGRVISFRLSGSLSSAEFLWEGSVPLRFVGSWPRSVTVLDDGTVFVADPEAPRVFAYDQQGRRLVAERPEADWEHLLGFLGPVRRVAPAAGRVLVLARESELLVFEHIP